MKRPTVKTEGFTLIELLIVVVILSTLAAIVVPQFANSSDSARVAATKSSLSGIRGAIETYRNDKLGKYPLEISVTRCSASTITIGNGTDATSFMVSMLYYSNSAGQICETKSDLHPHGPYLRAKVFPGNPLDSDSNTILVDTTTATLGLTASGVGAWKYQALTGEFIANQTDYEDY